MALSLTMTDTYVRIWICLMLMHLATTIRSPVHLIPRCRVSICSVARFYTIIHSPLSIPWICNMIPDIEPDLVYCKSSIFNALKF